MAVWKSGVYPLYYMPRRRSAGCEVTKSRLLLQTTAAAGGAEVGGVLCDVTRQSPTQAPPTGRCSRSGQEEQAAAGGWQKGRAFLQKSSAPRFHCKTGKRRGVSESASSGRGHTESGTSSEG